MIDAQQLLSLAERFVSSCERAAFALEGVSETYRRIHKHENPERGKVREAILTRIPNREDRIREAQGATGQPLDEWVSDVADEEAEDQYVGPRDREWAINHPERTR